MFSALISHYHKTIFIHIPKNGGQSIENVFLSDLGLSREERLPLLMCPNNISSIGPPRLAHLIGSDYFKYHYISRDLFDSYFSFSVVRNPWHRVFSFYKFLTKQLIPFNEFVNRNFYSKYFCDSALSWFVRPQADYLFDDSNTLLVNNIYRLESLSKSFDEIRTLSHLPNSAVLPFSNKSSPSRLVPFLKRLRIVNSSFGMQVKDVYDDKAFKLVSDLYAVDCEKFSYTSL